MPICTSVRSTGAQSTKYQYEAMLKWGNTRQRATDMIAAVPPCIVANRLFDGGNICSVRWRLFECAHLWSLVTLILVVLSVSPWKQALALTRFHAKHVIGFFFFFFVLYDVPTPLNSGGAISVHY